MSSFSSFIDRRRAKNGSNSPGSSLFMQASNNASKASLVSMESRDSGYRNPWNDSGIDLEGDNNMYGQNGHSHSGNGWGSFGGSASRPNTSSNSLSGAFGETKFPFGVNGNASTTSLTTTPMIPGLGMVNGTTAPGAPGDATPRYDAKADGAAAKQATAGAASSTGALAASNSAPVSRPASTSNPTTTTTTSPPSTATMTTNTTTSAAAKSSGYPAPIAPPH
ncbi:hypothetical protein KC362_g18481 [Hortaea werneckii]|nr:hypothetical protein KC362_g18481 [Hortaea werneckii]